VRIRHGELLHFAIEARIYWHFRKNGIEGASIKDLMGDAVCKAARR
jgi:hypothetical protein